MALVLNGDGPITGLSSLTFPGDAGTITGLGAAAIPASKIGAGAVIQVVSAENTTTVNMSTGTSSVWTSTNTTATITPRYSSSKILVMVMQSTFHENAGAQGTGFRVYRNGSAITTENGFTASYQGANRIHAYHPITYMDSPASTSALTYTIYGSIWNTGGTCVFQYGGSESTSRIVLMEIAQ